MRQATGLFALLMISWGCCSADVHVMPKEDGTTLAVSHSRSGSCAYKKAKEKAEEYCSHKHKSFALIKDDQKYQGMDKTAKGAIHGVGYATGHYVNLDTSDDYEVRLEFRCK